MDTMANGDKILRLISPRRPKREGRLSGFVRMRTGCLAAADKRAPAERGGHSALTREEAFFRFTAGVFMLLCIQLQESYSVFESRVAEIS